MIFDLSLLDLDFIVEGANQYGEKQKQEMDKHSKSGNKFQVSNINQLKGLPGVKVNKRK